MIWTRLTLSLLSIVVLLQGCNSADEFQSEGVRIDEVYQLSNYDVLNKRKVFGINDGFIRSQAQELETRFPMLPNPVLHMFVFPHLTKDGYPVPGYTTNFTLYERDQYALPGEFY